MLDTYRVYLNRSCNFLISGHIVRRIDACQSWHRQVAYPGFFFSWGYARNFFRRGVYHIQLRTEGRENGDLGTVAPSQGFHSICRVKPVFWLCCYRCIFHGSGNSAQLCQNFGIFFYGGGGVEPPIEGPSPTIAPWYGRIQSCVGATCFGMTPYKR
jgi:hypothetical protein